MNMRKTIPHRAHPPDLPVSGVFQLMFVVVVLLGTGIYIFSELVTMLAFVAAFVVFGTRVVLFVLLLQDRRPEVARSFARV